MMNITKAVIDRLTTPEKKQQGRTEQKRYYDSKLKGFGIRITSGGTKSFFIEKLINRRLKRITIGHYPAITSEQARKEAHKLLGKIATGIDPLAEKKIEKIKKVTLQEVFTDYIAARKDLKSSSITDYQKGLKQVIPDWLDKPILNITKDMIAKRHAHHGETISKSRSNLSMRVLRALFNFAMHQYETDNGNSIIQTNPVNFLSHARSWYRIERKQSLIKSHQLYDWYKGLMELNKYYSKSQAEMWRDYFLLVLFSGKRRQEVASLHWKDIDFEGKTFTSHDTKNGNSHILPMSDFIHEIFLRRETMRNGNYVFPANSNLGYIVEPRKAMQKIIDHSAVEFTVHDLRRTFITTAESLDISAYALKRLLNHSTENDVTSGYLIIDVERLRKPMQQISEHFLKQMQLA